MFNAFRASVLIMLSAIIGCCPTMDNVPIANPIGALKGYQYAFPFPRTDVPPGSVVIRWDSGQIDVVCRPADYHQGSMDGFVIPSPSIDISEQQKSALKAQITADVKGIVEGTLGGNAATAIAATMTFTPASVTSGQAVQESSRATLCKERAKLLREIHGKRLNRIAVASDVAEFSFDFDITMSRDIGVDAKLGEKLSAKLDASASIGASNTNHIKVSGKKTYTNYNLTTTQLLQNL